MLASGLSFSSLIAIPFALTVPGAFAPTGLLGAGPQSAAWLKCFPPRRFSPRSVEEILRQMLLSR
jgi:hypothetical protein